MITTRKIKVKSKEPKIRHFIDGIQTNAPQEKKLFLRERLVVKSDNFFSFQLVTDRQGNETIEDVFEYGDTYVVMKDDGTKYQVQNTNENEWIYT